MDASLLHKILLAVDDVETCGEVLHAIHADTGNGVNLVVSIVADDNLVDAEDGTLGRDEGIAGLGGGRELEEVTGVGGYNVGRGALGGCCCGRH